MGLYNTKTTQITALKYSELELVDDPKALDGQPLTDGCSIIAKHIVDEKVGKHVVSMLARLGGSKCMLIAMTPDWIKKVIETDQTAKRTKILKDIKAEKSKQKADLKRLESLNEALSMNENRNFSANVVITKSSRKFDFGLFVSPISPFPFPWTCSVPR